MDERFLTAFLMPPTWNVGGVVLKPFCLRHLMTLQSISHPFVTPGKTCEPDDVVIALRICSSDLGIASIEAKPTWAEKWLCGRLVASPRFMGEVMVGFVRYTEMYSTPPKVWEKPEDPGTIDIRKEKIPAILMLVAVLIRKTTISEEDAWRMPIGKMSWYATAIAIVDGVDLSTISTEDEKRFDAEREALEKFTAVELAKAQRNRPPGAKNQ